MVCREGRRVIGVTKFRRILVLAVLLAVSLMTLAMADEQSEILIDSSRNAAIKIKNSENADGMSGNFNLAGDVVKGLISGAVDLKFSPEVAKQLGDAQGALYYTMTDMMEIVGHLDMPVPPEAAKELTKLDGNMESAVSGSKAYGKGNFNLEAKSQEEVPTINADLSAKGSGKEFDGKLNFDVDAAGAAANLPFKSFDFGISEKDASTTLSIGVAVDAASQQAKSLKQMGQNPDQIKKGITSQFGNMGITVENVEIGEYKEEGGAASAKISITIKDWRNVLKTNLPMMAGGGQYDAEKLTAAVTQMLEAKFDNVAFNLKVEGKVVKGSLNGKVTNMRQLALGYYKLTSMIAEAQLRDMGGSHNPGQRLMLAYQTVAMDEAQKAIQAAIDADMGFDMTGKVKVAGEGEDKKTVKASGDFNIDFSNYPAYITKAQAAQLPTPKNAAFKLVLGVAGQGRINGSLYAYSDANIINYYKKLILAAARKSGAPEEAMATADKVEFKSSAGALSVTKDGVKGANYLESNDLTPVAKALLGAATRGQLEGDLTGFAVAGKGEGEKMNIELTANFAKFMPGKSGDEVKKALHAPSKVAVKDSAKTEEVTLMAVAKPEVAMPDSLKPVAADGKTLLASNPIAAMGGALGGGGSSLLYILGGLAAVGVVGVGVAAGRKKS